MSDNQHPHQPLDPSEAANAKALGVIAAIVVAAILLTAHQIAARAVEDAAAGPTSSASIDEARP